MLSLVLQLAGVLPLASGSAHPAARVPLSTAEVHNTAELKAALNDSSVDTIEAFGGHYLLADSLNLLTH